MAKNFAVAVKVNTVDLCYSDRKFKYNVADVDNFGWEMIAYGLIYKVIKQDTDYSLADCRTGVYVKFREPKENENQDSMISIVNVETVAPNGMLIRREREYDAEKLTYVLPQGVIWGYKADRENSQNI